MTTDLHEGHLKYFSFVSSVFVTVLLISNTVSSKMVSLGPFVISGGIVIFPIAYIFGDILTEVYGYKRSRKIIWTGFGCLLFMSVVYTLVGVLPSAPGWENQTAYETILGLVPRIALASLIAYWVGEFVNSYTLAKMKVWSEGRHLWMRTIGSTIIGEAVDTLFFTMIAFYGTLPASVLIQACVSGYFLKVAYEVIATPLTYKIVSFLKREEGFDHFDERTNFNPFRL